MGSLRRVSFPSGNRSVGYQYGISIASIIAINAQSNASGTFSCRFFPTV
ncbi:hypothetical protein [Methanogenium sp. MK-MG]|nr:hypothetical protein [Methanogenium sp. MK-MG]